MREATGWGQVYFLDIGGCAAGTGFRILGDTMRASKNPLCFNIVMPDPIRHPVLSGEGVAHGDSP